MGCWRRFVFAVFLPADVGKQPKFEEVIDAVRKVVKVFSRNAAPNWLLDEQRKIHKVGKGLQMDCATRFASKHQMIGSVLANKHTLRSTVVLEKFPLHEDR